MFSGCNAKCNYRFLLCNGISQMPKSHHGLRVWQRIWLLPDFLHSLWSIDCSIFLLRCHHVLVSQKNVQWLGRSAGRLCSYRKCTGVLVELRDRLRLPKVILLLDAVFMPLHSHGLQHAFDVLGLIRHLLAFRFDNLLITVCILLRGSGLIIPHYSANCKPLGQLQHAGSVLRCA